MPHNPFFNPENYIVVIIPAIMWISAQLLKFAIYTSKHGINWRYLFEYGHMPSSHASCISALVFSVGYYEGANSPVFAVALTVGLLTLYDAVKLRSYIGEYGKTLNKIIKETGHRKKYPRLKERVGHTISEVLSGVIVGAVGAFILIQAFKALI